MKRLSIFILLTSAIGLGALTIPNREIITASGKKAPQQLIVREVKQGEATMKPAWYRFFNPHQTNIIESKEHKILDFKLKEVRESEKMISFDITNVSEYQINIRTQDGSLIMIQEAKNQEGKWQPIEYWDYDWGFDPYFDKLKLNPQQSILITAPKYEGKFKTQIRLKLKIGEENEANDIYYSEPFEGSVEISQFKQNPQNAGETISFLGEKQ